MLGGVSNQHSSVLKAPKSLRNNAAVQRLKDEAAKVGANGVLLLGLNDRDVASTTVGYGLVYGDNTHIMANVVGVKRGGTHAKAQGVAIYIPSVDSQ